MADINTISFVLLTIFHLGRCVPDFPEPLQEFNLLHKAEVTTSQTCTGNGVGYTCSSDYCKNRQNTPSPQYILKAATPQSQCDMTLASTPPSGAVEGNGKLHLEGSASENCTVSKNLGNIPQKYSLSFWIQQNCASCEFFSVKNGAGSTVAFKKVNNGLGIEKQGSLILNGIGTLSSGSTWFHIVVIQRSSMFEVYINDTLMYNGSAVTLPSGSQVTVNVTTDLSNGDKVSYLDFRYYSVPLTDRERVFVKTGNFSGHLGPGSDCRCPDSAPSVTAHDDKDRYGLKCTTTVDSSATQDRLKTESHLPVFAVDSSDKTSWISGPVSSSAWLNLKLMDTYQIDGVSVKFKDTLPNSLDLKFTSKYGESQHNVQVADGQSYVNWTAPAVSSITKRRDLYKYLANNVRMTMTGFKNSSINYYEVSSIQLTVRINCHGSALIASDDGKCTCLPLTNTENKDCGTCVAGKYHDVDGFLCDKNCSCNSIGSDQTSTCKAGGQCFCKSNVEGISCDKCKHLTYNLTASHSNGCSSCLCNAAGTSSCDVNTGDCSCKTNVVDKNSDKCGKCEDGYYGFNVIANANGCKSCQCNPSGSDSNAAVKCDDANGACTCKENVQGAKCDKCKDEYYKLDYGNSKGCSPCNCNTVGSQNLICDKSEGQCPCRENLRQNKQCDAIFDSTDLIPNYAPMAGGTLIMITGHLFGDNTSTVRAYIRTTTGTPETFVIESVSDNELKMTSPSKSTLGKETVTVQWMGVKTVPNNHDFNKAFSFEFKPNPIVSSVSEPITYFKSGGCGLTLGGQNLDSLYKPKLLVHTGSSPVLSQPCEVTGGTTIKCRTPYLMNFNGTEVQYGLERVKNYTNLNDVFPNKAILKLADPPTVKKNSDMEINFPFSKSVFIEGEGFTRGCSESDFVIKIGDENCPIKFPIKDNMITCEPKQDFPGKSLDGNLVLYIGDFNATIGMVSMKSFWGTQEFIYIAVGAGAFVLIVIILIVVCCCCCCRRRKKADSGHDKILESNGDVDLVAYNQQEKSKTKDVKNEYTSLDTSNGQKSKQNKYTDVPLTPSDSSAVHSPIKPEISNPVNPDKYNIDTTSSKDDFLNMLDASLRDSVKQSLSSPEHIKPGVMCTKKGQHIRVINGEFKEGPFRGQQATLKTFIKDIKSFGDGSLPRWGSNGISECLRFRDLFHDNIVFTCGMVVNNSRFYIMYPSTKRILKDYLNDKTKEFQLFELIEMCQQVADAMSYLSHSQITHKDLAARNCVITEDNMVKVTDAAFSWDLFPDEYMYDSDRERYLPVRWLAVDSLVSGYYDTSTDVWSFGVLMWEVSARALILPYPDIKNNQDIKDHVTKGYRPGQSNSIPPDLYNLMTQCWNKKPTSRPTFDSIVESLLAILHPDDGQMVYENQENLQMQNLPTYGNTADQSYNNPAFQS